MKMLSKLVRDPFLWWIILFLFGITQVSAALPVDVLSRNPLLQAFCSGVGAWLPWVPKTASTYANFPEVASLLLTVMWASLPLQIATVMWMLPRSAILQSQTIPYLHKYPVRFPVGVTIVAVLALTVMIGHMDAEDVSGLTGTRPSVFLSNMPGSQSWFGFGVGFLFFAVSMLLGSLSSFPRLKSHIKSHQGG